MNFKHTTISGAAEDNSIVFDMCKHLEKSGPSREVYTVKVMYIVHVAFKLSHMSAFSDVFEWDIKDDVLIFNLSSIQYGLSRVVVNTCHATLKEMNGKSTYQLVRAICQGLDKTLEECRTITEDSIKASL